jgi:hypothetical protein
LKEGRTCHGRFARHRPERVFSLASDGANVAVNYTSNEKAAAETVAC